jgi:hypothetical protein
VTGLAATSGMAEHPQRSPETPHHQAEIADFR